MTSIYDTICAEIKEALDSAYLKRSDVVDNLTTNDSSKPLSAKQGMVLKEYADSLIGNIEEDMLL